MKSEYKGRHWNTNELELEDFEPRKRKWKNS